jgi:hypothetical protein
MIKSLIKFCICNVESLRRCMTNMKSEYSWTETSLCRNAHNHRSSYLFIETGFRNYWIELRNNEIYLSISWFMRYIFYINSAQNHGIKKVPFSKQRRRMYLGQAISRSNSNCNKDNLHINNFFQVVHNKWHHT